MYRILLERAAEKDLKRLSAEIHDRVIAAIQGRAETPRPSGCRKLAGSANDWRIRVGDYRIVYEIADTKIQKQAHLDGATAIQQRGDEGEKRR